MDEGELIGAPIEKNDPDWETSGSRKKRSRSPRLLRGKRKKRSRLMDYPPSFGNQLRRTGWIIGRIEFMEVLKEEF
jgi:hypothetical protein